MHEALGDVARQLPGTFAQGDRLDGDAIERGLPPQRGILWEEERATAMGVYQAVYAIGMFLGPLVGGAVGEAAGLGAIFVSTGALQLGATAVAWRILNARA